MRKSTAILSWSFGGSVIGTALTGGWWIYVVTRPGEHQGAGFILIPALLIGFFAGAAVGAVLGLARAKL
jgi:hypothetical protein